MSLFAFFEAISRQRSETIFASNFIESRRIFDLPARTATTTSRRHTQASVSTTSLSGNVVVSGNLERRENFLAPLKKDVGVIRSKTTSKTSTTTTGATTSTTTTTTTRKTWKWKSWTVRNRQFVATRLNENVIPQ